MAERMFNVLFLCTGVKPHIIEYLKARRRGCNLLNALVDPELLS